MTLKKTTGILVGESLIKNLKAQKISPEQKILKILVGIHQVKSGMPVKDLIQAAKRAGIKPTKTKQILKKFEQQQRLQINQQPVIYPNENYYFWHDQWD